MTTQAINTNTTSRKLDVNRFAKEGQIKQMNGYADMPISHVNFYHPTSVAPVADTWRELVHTLLMGSLNPHLPFAAHTDFTCWAYEPEPLFGPNEHGAVDELGVLLAPEATSVLVLDFYGREPSSYFDELQYLSYCFYDHSEPDAQKHRMLFPMLREMRLRDFVRLRSTIVQWADRHSNGVDLASYEAGRFFTPPWINPANSAPFYNAGGHILDWTEFDSMKESGEDMTLL